MFCKLSSCGLVVKAENSWSRGPGFKPPEWRPFFRHHLIGLKLGTKFVETLTWHCCMCCNPANGRVDFEEWSAYKTQLHGKEWIVSLSTDWDQSPKSKKKSFMFWPKEFTLSTFDKITWKMKGNHWKVFLLDNLKRNQGCKNNLKTEVQKQWITFIIK